MLGTAVKSLRGTTYDFSIDIRFSDSPMHQILPFIDVKHSIGFGTRGLGGLLDEELFLPEGEFHHIDLLLSLLAKIDVHLSLPDIKPYFAFPPNAQATLAKKLPLVEKADQPLIVVFPESGASSRFLPVAFWEELLSETLQHTEALIISCGQLPSTTALLMRMKAKHPDQTHRLIDATGQLTIDELAALASRATLAFTVDSFPAHMCAIFCPLITFYNNGMGIQFFPISNFDTLLFHNHLNSRDLLMNRSNYQTIFTEEFDANVVALSMQKVKQLVNRVMQ
jgi:heptosyltransferase-3